MGKVVINSYEDFEKLVGQQIGISDYPKIRNYHPIHD